MDTKPLTMLERKHANTFGKHKQDHTKPINTELVQRFQISNDLNQRDSKANLEMSDNDLLKIGSHLDEENKLNIRSIEEEEFYQRNDPSRGKNQTEKQIEESGSSGGTSSVELVMGKKNRASRQYKPNTIISRPNNGNKQQDIAHKEIKVSAAEFKIA
mgnify:CR=1 FL=1|jgi:hypothetical protein